MTRAWAYVDISKPLIAWLAYRGELFSVEPSHPEAVSVFVTERLRDGTLGNGNSLKIARQRWEGEIAIEEARRARHLNVVSRLHGFFCFPSLDDATRAAKWGNEAFTKECLTEIEIDSGSRVSTHDAEWVTYERLNGAGPWTDEYLSGAPRRRGEEHWEQVVEGTARILSDDLRERARASVFEREPRTVGVPLEVGRAAYLLGYPIGRATATVKRQPDRTLLVEYYVRFDAEDPSFIAELRRAMDDPSGPLDKGRLVTAFEDANDSFNVPDMRQYMFRIV